MRSRKDPDRFWLGGRIKKLRRAQRLTQANLAEKAGLTEKYIAAIEQGQARVNPTVTALQAIARALGIRFQDLFASTDHHIPRERGALIARVREESRYLATEKLEDILRILRSLSQ